MNTIDFSIITPSYNMLHYLKLCTASISDQKGVSFENIIVDAQSKDGTVKWLSAQPNIRYISEPDKGMYDAINKGMKIASGDIVAYLNCDEQYLPDTLSFVKEYFNTHPDVDFLFGDFFVINNDGSLVSYRKAFQPRWYYIQATHLYVFSCTMFFRRKIIEDKLFFDANYQVIADGLFVINLLRKGYKARHVRHYLSVYTVTGNNKSISHTAIEEQKKLYANNRRWLMRMAKLPMNIMRVTEKILHGCYYEKKPIRYAIYLPGSEERVCVTVKNATPFWGIKARY